MNIIHWANIGVIYCGYNGKENGNYMDYRVYIGVTSIIITIIICKTA